MTLDTPAIHDHTVQVGHLPDPVDVRVDAEVVDTTYFPGVRRREAHCLTCVALPLVMDRATRLDGLVVMTQEAGRGPLVGREPTGVRSVTAATAAASSATTTACAALDGSVLHVLLVDLAV